MNTNPPVAAVAIAVAGVARTLALALLALAGSSLSAAGASDNPTPASAYRETGWNELVPKGWDPYKDIRDIAAAGVADGSAEATQRMRDMRQVWDKAPTNQALEGAAVKLPGYVVPLEVSADGLKEFLLVPYFGACIHSPPPPANQIVHVVSAKPIKGFATMDAVWVSGTLSLTRQDTQMGASGYRLSAATVARYAPPAK
jgi:hypothetical protein